MNLILVSCYLNRIARKMPGKCKKAICSYNFPNLLCSKFYPSVCYLFSRFTWQENRVSQKRLQILGLTASNLQTFFSTPCFLASWTWKTSNSHMEKFSALQIWKIIGTKYYCLNFVWRNVWRAMPKKKEKYWKKNLFMFPSSFFRYIWIDWYLNSWSLPLFSHKNSNKLSIVFKISKTWRYC